MSGLELRVPPDVAWLAVGAIMWLAAKSTPGLNGAWTLRLLVAAACVTAGVGLIVGARIMLDRAHTTWHPAEPERTTSLVSGGVFRFKRENYNRSQITKIVGHCSYARMTTRNVNTARKLAALCEEV